LTIDIGIWQGASTMGLPDGSKKF